MSSEEGEIDLFMQSPYDSSYEEELEELDDSSLYGDEVITGTKVLIKIVVQYISCVSSQHGHVTDLLKSVEALPKLVEFKDNIDIMRYYFQELVSAMKELKVFFQVPNQHIISNITPTLNPNQVVAAFINFLLLMVEVILQSFEEDFIDCVKSSMEILQTELGFLITFLGDTASHLQPTNSTVMIDIEALVNEVGSFLYSFLFTIVVFILITDERYISYAVHMEVVVDVVRHFLNSVILNFLEDFPWQISEVERRKKQKNIKRNEKKKAITDIKALVHEVGCLLYFIIFTGNDHVRETGILHLALSNLLLKFELLKPKIKEHCIRVSKMPSVMTSKTAVVSLFIIDSVLDDLMDLINNKSERIVGVDDEIATLHEELMLLGSSITDIAVQHEAEHEELVIQTRDIAYEVEYVINSFPHVWYLTLRLPQLLEKIHKLRTKLTQMEWQKLQNIEVNNYHRNLKDLPCWKTLLWGLRKWKLKL